MVNFVGVELDRMVLHDFFGLGRKRKAAVPDVVVDVRSLGRRGVYGALCLLASSRRYRTAIEGKRFGCVLHEVVAKAGGQVVWGCKAL